MSGRHPQAPTKKHSSCSHHVVELISHKAVHPSEWFCHHHHCASRASAHTKEPTTLSPPSVASRPPIPTVVVVGNSGVGKSSIINMLDSSPPSTTNSDSDEMKDETAAVGGHASGCTQEPKCFNKRSKSKPFLVWDTAGLNEASHGTVPPDQAATQLNNLLMGQTHGISLVLMVMPAGRLSQDQENNYHLVRLLCGPDVPIALVITKADSLPTGGSHWWKDEEKEFKRVFKYSGAAVITASPGYQNRFQDAYERSVVAVRSLVDDMISSPSLVPSYIINPCPMIDKILNRIKMLFKKHPKDFHSELYKLLKEEFHVRNTRAFAIASDHSGTWTETGGTAYKATTDRAIFYSCEV